VTSTSANATRQRLARAGRRRFLLIMAIAAVMLVAADWFTGGVTRSWVSGKAELVVTSEPAGATVSIDGAAQGSTPVTLTVEPGHRTLLISHPYHPRHVEHLELTRDERVERQITLEPAWGALLIASNPKGARVTIDGVEQDSATPLQLDRIQAGLHEIVLRIPGRTTQRITAEVLPDTRAEVSAELERVRPRPPSSG